MDSNHSDAEHIERRIAELGDWRGELLAEIRAVVLGTDNAIIEEVKWRKPTNPLGVAVWSHHGILCTGETYKDKVKLTFANGASLADEGGLFNASMGGNVRRAIDFFAADDLEPVKLRALVQEAMDFNEADARS